MMAPTARPRPQHMPTSTKPAAKHCSHCPQSSWLPSSDGPATHATAAPLPFVHRAAPEALSVATTPGHDNVYACLRPTPPDAATTRPPRSPETAPVAAPTAPA